MSIEDIFEKIWHEKIWHEKSTNSNNTIMVHIRKLREKIERQPRNPRHIKTVWGIGYKFDLWWKRLRDCLLVVLDGDFLLI